MPRSDRLTVRHNGSEYDLSRVTGTEANLAATGMTWQLLHEGAPITSFPADAGETDAAVKEKALEWLKAQDDRPAADVNRN